MRVFRISFDNKNWQIATADTVEIAIGRISPRQFTKIIDGNILGQYILIEQEFPLIYLNVYVQELK